MIKKELNVEDSQELKLAMDQLQRLYERQSSKMVDLETELINLKESMTSTAHAQTTKIHKLEHQVEQLALSVINMTDAIINDDKKNKPGIYLPR